MRYGSSGAIFCCLTLMIGASGCSDGENKKRVNESCSDNTDCADDICHKGICADPNPADNGQP